MHEADGAAPGAPPLIMPQLGESIVEATLARWLVTPGIAVARGQPLAEVETDKATNEIPSPRSGVVDALLVGEGVTVPVGTPILRWRGDAAPAVPVAPKAPEPARPAATPAAAAPAGPAAATTAKPTSTRVADGRLVARGDGRPASPAVRRLARAAGVALDALALHGSGRGGRLTRDDLRAHLAAREAAPRADGMATPAPRAPVYRAPRYVPQPGDRVVPFSRRRAYVAEHLRASIEAATHVAAVVEIDMSRVVRARAEAKARAEALGTKLSVTAYVVHAIARALGEHPELNGCVTDDAHVIRKEKNIGVAVDAPEGLVVPVVHRADERSLLGLARAIDALADKARRGALDAADVAGGSFTVSNPGRDGNLFGISIIRQPELAILRMGEVQKRAVVRTIDGEDVIVIRPIMYAALSYDHRVIDGAKGNAFLHRVRALLETAPGTLD